MLHKSTRLVSGVVQLEGLGDSVGGEGPLRV